MNNIRNFCIIAHIDHGKSTLADRLLEITGTIEKRKMKEQVLDTMDLERERGITIKLQPATMAYTRIVADETRINADNVKQVVSEERGLLYEDLTYNVRGAIFNVYNELGSGHKESIYSNALEKEFSEKNIAFVKEKSVEVVYKNEKIGVYRPDFIVDRKIILELKALPFIGKKEDKQIWTYLKGSEYKLALLVNFGKSKLQIERIVYEKARNKNYISKNQRLHQQESVYQLNLIDTPGHVDFGYEVSRSLAAVEGAVLLVDATQGVQAQTLANLYQAIEQNLEIIPVINKIDLPNADVKKTQQEILSILGCKKEDIICASGKTGQGVDKILQAIVEKIPAPESPLEKTRSKSRLRGRDDNSLKSASLHPTNESQTPLRALIFDSKYDSYKGVLAYVRIVDGEVKAEDDIYLMAGGTQAHVIEVGKFFPQLMKKNKLSAGDIGYIATGLKSVGQCQVGDTIVSLKLKVKSEKLNQIQNKKNNLQDTDQNLQTGVQPLPGYKQVKPMVYASFYPTEGEDYNQFRDALEKLKLNDAALSFEGESSLAMGRGFRIGFLGLLHLEIIKERLKREFGFEPTITTPSVVYKIIKTDNQTQEIFAAAEMPEANLIKEIQEPRVKLNIITPSQYLGNIMELIQKSTRSRYLSTEYINNQRVIILFDTPLNEVIINLHDGIQSASSGFASFSYDLSGYFPADLVRLDIYVAEEKIEALSQIVPREKVEKEGRQIVKKLKNVIPRQNFLIKIQAAVGGKFLARENIQPFRKDVTGHLYGGDITRKRKLLEKQRKGKKKMKASGRAHIPQEAFLEVLKK